MNNIEPRYTYYRKGEDQTIAIVPNRVTKIPNIRHGKFTVSKYDITKLIPATPSRRITMKNSTIIFIALLFFVSLNINASGIMTNIRTDKIKLSIDTFDSYDDLPNYLLKK